MLINAYEMHLVQETVTPYSMTFTMPNFPALRYIHLNKITGIITIRTDNFFFTCLINGDEIRGGSFRWVDQEDESISMEPPPDVSTFFKSTEHNYNKNTYKILSTMVIDRTIQGPNVLQLSTRLALLTSPHHTYKMIAH
ncbi:hypothetical protein QTP88_006515 [Uroleucon formosanum]